MKLTIHDTETKGMWIYDFDSGMPIPRPGDVVRLDLLDGGDRVVTLVSWDIAGGLVGVHIRIDTP